MDIDEKQHKLRARLMATSSSIASLLRGDCTATTAMHVATPIEPREQQDPEGQHESTCQSSRERHDTARLPAAITQPVQPLTPPAAERATLSETTIIDSDSNQRVPAWHDLVKFLSRFSLPLPVDALTLHHKALRHDCCPALASLPHESLLDILQDLATTGAIGIEQMRITSKRLVVMVVDVKTEVVVALAARSRRSNITSYNADVTTVHCDSGIVGICDEGLCSPRTPRDRKGATSRMVVKNSPTKSSESSASRSSSAEVIKVLERPTALESYAAETFKKGTPSLREYCPYSTKVACRRGMGDEEHARCKKVHFRKVISSHTEPSLGDCAYLATCRKPHCKFVHYAIDEDEEEAVSVMDQTKESAANVSPHKSSVGVCRTAPPSSSLVTMGKQLPPQWINGDVRRFDLSVLGHFDVILADPPWQIHMELPYGTMTDDEVKAMDLARLQGKDGVLFLWVTGRAMERGREVMRYWGYKQMEEVVWIKTNQLQKLIRTGRTGHWFNHSKEHCLIGVKGCPRVNRHIDCDVVVSESRETSRKPEEVYNMIERLSPGTRKLEIFGRSHNIRPGWLTIGNQLPPTRLVEPDVIGKYNRRYPQRTYVPDARAEAWLAAHDM